MWHKPEITGFRESTSESEVQIRCLLIKQDHSILKPSSSTFLRLPEALNYGFPEEMILPSQRLLSFCVFCVSSFKLDSSEKFLFPKKKSYTKRLYFFLNEHERSVLV